MHWLGPLRRDEFVRDWQHSPIRKALAGAEHDGYDVHPHLVDQARGEELAAGADLEGTRLPSPGPTRAERCRRPVPYGPFHLRLRIVPKGARLRRPVQGIVSAGVSARHVRSDVPLLVAVAAPGPLDDRGAGIVGRPGHVQYQAAVRGDDPYESVAHRLDTEPLVAPSVPRPLPHGSAEVRCCPRDVEHQAAVLGHESNRAVTLVLHGEVLVRGATRRPLDERSAWVGHRSGDVEDEAAVACVNGTGPSRDVAELELVLGEVPAATELGALAVVPTTEEWSGVDIARSRVLGGARRRSLSGTSADPASEGVHKAKRAGPGSRRHHAPLVRRERSTDATPPGDIVLRASGRLCRAGHARSAVLTSSAASSRSLMF